MYILEHYFTLKKHYDDVKDGEETFSSISDVSKILYCSIRNANFILNKIKENGWITWQSERGRGKKSRLIFKKSMISAANDHLLYLIEQKGLEKAYEFIKEGPFSNDIMKSLVVTFESKLGFQIIKKRNTRRDVLTIGLKANIKTLDPIKSFMVNEQEIITQIFDRLVVYDEETKSIKPHLVHSWDTKDGMTWTFYLRKGIQFHHLRELTAEDVIYTFSRLKQKETSRSKLFQDLQRVEAKDPYTVTFYLSQTNYMFLNLLWSNCASILPHDVILDEKIPIGTGSFMVTNHINEKLTLEAFSGYFKERPFLDQINVLFLSKTVEKLDISNFISINKDISKGSNYFIFNFRKVGMEHDVHFRKSIKALLNRQHLIDDLKEISAVPSSSINPERSKKIGIKTFSIKEAKAHLEKSNYNGEEIILCYCLL